LVKLIINYNLNQGCRPATKPPYKYSVLAYGGNMADMIGVAAFGR